MTLRELISICDDHLEDSILDSGFQISAGHSKDDTIGHIYFESHIMCDLPNHPAFILKNGMLAINLNWTPED